MKEELKRVAVIGSCSGAIGSLMAHAVAATLVQTKFEPVKIGKDYMIDETVIKNDAYELTEIKRPYVPVNKIGGKYIAPGLRRGKNYTTPKKKRK